MPSVLFVCLGNICRSPAAEGILRHAAERNQCKDLHVKSCGLGNWHLGHLPDGRMQDAAKRRGIVLSSRAQQFKQEFFDLFDYILVADHSVLHSLRQQATSIEHKAKIHLITAFSRAYPNEEVPDPYYNGDAAFDLVLDMLEDACEGFLDHIKSQ